MAKLSEDFLAWLDSRLEPSDFKRKPATSVANIQYNLLVDLQLPLRQWLNFLVLHDFPYEGLSLKEVLAAILQMNEAEWNEIVRGKKNDKRKTSKSTG